MISHAKQQISFFCWLTQMLEASHCAGISKLLHTDDRFAFRNLSHRSMSCQAAVEVEVLVVLVVVSVVVVVVTVDWREAF